MNTHTGELREFTENEPVGPDWVPVSRDLKLKEKAEMQIRLYSPCGCGSGKKFKFCCKSKTK